MAKTTIDSSTVTADFGAYYIAGGQGENDIHTRLTVPFGTREAFTVIETDDTILRKSNATFGELLQSFQTAFTPKGGVVFTPKEIKLFNIKMDILVFPDDLGDNWLAFLKSKNLNRSEWPFIRWMTEVYVMKQMDQDLETQIIHNGTYLSPTAGTAGAAINAMDGTKKLINAELAGPAVAIPTGTPSTDAVTWCTQVEAFCAGVPELYQTQTMKLNMSPVLFRRYKKGRREKYNMTYAQVSDLSIVEDFENITIVPRLSLVGKNKIWMTPQLNAVLAMNTNASSKPLRIEQVDRQVKIYGDWWMGAGFIDGGILFTNDQETI